MKKQGSKQGKIRVYFETYGCSANFNNTELMMGLLVKDGFLIVDDPKSADVLVINTCIVKSPTETKMWNRIKQLYTLKKPLIITGCMPEVYKDKIMKQYPRAFLVGPRRITEILRVVNLALEDSRLEVPEQERAFLGKEKLIKLGIPRINKNKVIAIIQISDGCLGSCSYCSVKLAKGSLFSYPLERIVDEVRKVVNDGVKEIWLTSQDNSAYEVDFSSSKKSKLPQLLESITRVKGDFKVRVGMMNPNFILPVLDDLINAFSSKKIFKFIHIPVQSGNNRILKLMRREYSVSDFKRIIDAFRQEFKRISLSTDVICGFPTETEEEFLDTVRLIKEVKPDVLNISRFWSRPYTQASRLKQIPGFVIKQRSRLMTQIFNEISLEKNKEWFSWQGSVLIDEFNKKNKSFIGRNYVYKPIVILGNNKNLVLGDKVRVKITDYTTHDLRANLRSGLRRF